MDPSLVVPGLAALAGVAGGSAVLLERRTTRVMQRAATARGWSWTARDDDEAVRPGSPFDRGSQRTARHVLRGQVDGHAATVFELRCRTPTVDAAGQRTGTTTRAGVGVLRLPAFLPLVELTPRRGPGLLGRGLELESADFGARYRVRADDPRLAYDLLPARTLQLLLDRPALRLRLLGAEAVTWRPGALDPDDAVARLETVAAVLAGVPAWVWRDHGAA